MFRPVFFAALLMAASAAHAGDKPLYAPAPDWVKPAPPIAASAPGQEAPIFLILDQQQRLEDGQVWAYVDGATRIASSDILTQAGTVQLQWQPDDGDLTVHRAAILRDGQEIDLLGTGKLFTVLRRESQLEQLEMNGVLTATMAAEGLRVGDVLRVTYSVTTRDRALRGNVQSLLPLLFEPARVGFGRVRLLWKTGSPLNYRGYQPGVTLRTKETGGYREAELSLPLAKPAELPNDAPLRIRGLPLLDVTSFADWAAVSKTMAPLYRTDGLIPAGSPLAAEVARIAKASDDPRVRTAAALELVQGQIRYLYAGMNGGNYRPQTPAQTWSLRYGDCKAKTLLLLALLHGLGVEAEAVNAHSQWGDTLPARLPMPAAFDHVLVRATIAGKSLWLDGTGQGARIADLDDAPPFVWVLPLREAGAELMPVPRRAAARVDMRVALEMDQSAGIGLPTPYRSTVTLRGQMGSQLATAVKQLSTKERREMLQGFLNTLIGESQTFDESLVEDSADGTTVIKASGLMTSGWRRDDRRYSRLLDHIAPNLTFDPDRTRPAWRDIPAAIGGNGSNGLQFDTVVTLPLDAPGFTLDGDMELPARLAGAEVRRSVTLDRGVVRASERIDTIGGEVAPKEIAAERTRLALAKTRLLRVMAPADYPPRWKVIEASRRAGRLKPIEAFYARAIAADSKDRLGYLNRAAFRSGTYDWRGAIGDYDKVIEIEPDIDSYGKRAWLYETIGDYPRALADATTAFELDSGLATTGRLVRLQAKTGKGDAALALLDERIAAGGGDKIEYLQTKSEVLSQLGRGVDAVAAADLAIKEKPGNAGLYNGRCWAKAINDLALDTALKDCSKAIELGESPAAAFDSRALVYYRMGRMDDALADLEAALDISPGLPASLYLRGLIRRRTGKTAEGDADLAAARLMSPRIDEDYSRWGVKA